MVNSHRTICKDPACFMGKVTKCHMISMARFNSYLILPEGYEWCWASSERRVVISSWVRYAQNHQVLPDCLGSNPTLKDRRIKHINLENTIYSVLLYHVLDIWTTISSEILSAPKRNESGISERSGLAQGLPQALKIQVVHHSLGMGRIPEWHMLHALHTHTHKTPTSDRILW